MRGDAEPKTWRLSFTLCDRLPACFLISNLSPQVGDCLHSCVGRLPAAGLFRFFFSISYSVFLKFVAARLLTREEPCRADLSFYLFNFAFFFSPGLPRSSE